MLRYTSSTYFSNNNVSSYISLVHCLYENTNDRSWKYELSDNIDAFVPNKSFLITYVDNTIRVMPYKNVKEEMTKKITMSENDN